MLKAFDYVDHNKLENSQTDGNTRPLYLPAERLACRSRSKLEPDMEKQTGSKLGRVRLCLNGHEFEQTLGDSEGGDSKVRSLVCCSPWGHKELDMN